MKETNICVNRDWILSGKMKRLRAYYTVSRGLSWCHCTSIDDDRRPLSRDGRETVN